jgi:hypothetical protein
MLARWNSVALLAVALAVVPAVVGAAPRARPKKPVKKATPAPAPAPPSEAAVDEPVVPPQAIPPGSPAGGGAAGAAGAGSAGGGSGEPPTKPAEPEPDRPAEVNDVDSLRQEYLSLRDELFKSRARANAVASQLYSTRIQIKLTYTTARFYSPTKASIRLDGASVYEDAGGAIGGDDGVRFDGYVAPGRHLITFLVEATGKDDDSFSSTTESQIVVKAVAGKNLTVSAKARDAGDIAYEWKRSERGSYGLGIDVAVQATQPAAAAKAAR